MTQKTFKSGRDTFCLRQREPGATWNVYYCLTGRGRGQMVWISTSESDKPEHVLAAIARGRRNGEF